MNNNEELVENNIGLVYAVAKKFINRGVEYEDLVQIGSIGLIKAAAKFDASLGFKFSTYAVNLIIGEIKRFLRDDGIVKISRKIKENLTKINYSKENLKQILNREPTIREISKHTTLSEEDIVEALNSETFTQSIYDINDEREDYSNSNFQNREYSKTEEKLYINEMLKKLDQRSKEVIILRYYHDCTQQQIANVLNISQVQVSRIEKAAINKMKYYS